MTEPTDHELEMVAYMRQPAPCVLLNEEAVSLIERVTDGCNCPGCRFLRVHIECMAMIEAEGETKQ